jgi:hypothetical protein
MGDGAATDADMSAEREMSLVRVSRTELSAWYWLFGVAANAFVAAVFLIAVFVLWEDGWGWSLLAAFGVLVQALNVVRCALRLDWSRFR